MVIWQTGAWQECSHRMLLAVTNTEAAECTIEVLLCIANLLSQHKHLRRLLPCSTVQHMASAGMMLGLFAAAKC